MLEISCEAQRVTGLGYAGVDIVLDAQRGPLCLEVNRRPGLDIQKANGSGLLPRLRAIEGLQSTQEAPEIRVLRAMEMDRNGWNGLKTGRGSRGAPLPPLNRLPLSSFVPDRGLLK